MFVLKERVVKLKKKKLGWDRLKTVSKPFCGKPPTLSEFLKIATLQIEVLRSTYYPPVTHSQSMIIQQ